ncbi:putative 3-hydroxybutyryl-CoA dehydrogenase [Candidatus Glomeribacter gigasporarum BEG34]|uniref:Putative 3-hydroxybutyryl-CoA dehydrogenase n=1 Tax=Candidatus Glomeribacter gigasporarum BEG34 TaxID=1070319 RepID=G2JBT8_9BURK|nr:hypothetical protein [Candidatus Glomeribacter gigasporarum]CCD30243.1 putative 3-hydroxybutyryl-CoA dehydrogenase [Candidatus Glomeribacter gigasporarum BEG34]
MKLKLDTSPKDRILVELDGTVVTMFMRTGFLRSITRTKYACTDSAAVSAFSITSTKTNENATAPHALVFVSEAAGQEKVAIIERFRTDADAQVAFMRVQQALHRLTVARKRQHRLRILGRLIALPLLVFVVSMSLVRFLDSHHGSLAALDRIMRAAGTIDEERFQINDVR